MNCIKQHFPAIMAAIFTMIALSPSVAIDTLGQNPFLPLWEYIPDGEPYVFEDPDKPGEYRVYIYGSHDSYYFSEENLVVIR